MPTFVHDTKTKRFVIISPVRQNRPTSSTPHPTHVCVFCPGNEALTPPEVFRMLKKPTTYPSTTLRTSNPPFDYAQGKQPTTDNLQPTTNQHVLWSVRVIPNKYPITDIHEVFILSPQHTADFPILDLEQVQQVMAAFHQRFVAHKDKGNIIIFGNHGMEAGASIAHPHAQLVVIPKEIPFDAVEKQPVANVITETEQFTLYCPEFSQWPYEVWIAPKRESISFAETEETERNALGFLMQKIIKTYRAAETQDDFPFHHENRPFAYNYYFSHANNFYVRIIPRFIHRAGFELGTGLSVNTIPPSEAATYLKNIWNSNSASPSPLQGQALQTLS